jgi:ATP-dependent DNA helicase PIF1
LNAPGPSLTEVRTERFCFESYVWEAAGLNCVHGSINLKEVVRQNDIEFINLLNSIRIGKTPPHLMKMLDDCVVSKKKEPTDGIIPTKLYCINKDVDEENKNRLAAIDSDEVNILCDDSWTIIPNSNFTRTKIHEIADKVIPSILTLKRGAQVVLLRNRGNDLAKYNYKITSGIANAKKPLVNGSRGIVLGFQRSTNDKDSMLVRVQFDNGDVVDIGKVEHEISGPDGEGLLVRNQIPLKLAW